MGEQTSICCCRTLLAFVVLTWICLCNSRGNGMSSISSAQSPNSSMIVSHFPFPRESNAPGAVAYFDRRGRSQWTSSPASSWELGHRVSLAIAYGGSTATRAKGRMASSVLSSPMIAVAQTARIWCSRRLKICGETFCVSRVFLGRRVLSI